MGVEATEAGPRAIVQLTAGPGTDLATLEAAVAPGGAALTAVAEELSVARATAAANEHAAQVLRAEAASEVRGSTLNNNIIPLHAL